MSPNFLTRTLRLMSNKPKKWMLFCWIRYLNLWVVNDSGAIVVQVNSYSVSISLMALREPLKMRKISGNQTQREHGRNYTILPGRLTDTTIEKDCFVGRLKENTLGFFNIQLRRIKRVTIH